MVWKEALNQRGAGQRFQGPNRAGQPGMGGGNIPYAPGATQTTPSQSPPTHVSTPQATLPQGAGNGAAMSPGSGQPAQPATGAPGASQGQMPQVDPMALMRYANYLMQRYMMPRNYRG